MICSPTQTHIISSIKASRKLMETCLQLFCPPRSSPLRGDIVSHLIVDTNDNIFVGDTVIVVEYYRCCNVVPPIIDLLISAGITQYMFIILLSTLETNY